MTLGVSVMKIAVSWPGQGTSSWKAYCCRMMYVCLWLFHSQLISAECFEHKYHDAYHSSHTQLNCCLDSFCMLNIKQRTAACTLNGSRCIPSRKSMMSYHLRYSHHAAGSVLKARKSNAAMIITLQDSALKLSYLTWGAFRHSAGNPPPGGAKRLASWPSPPSSSRPQVPSLARWDSFSRRPAA